MNRRARELGLHDTHYANADRPRRAGQLLERRGPGQADADPAPQRVLPRGDQPAARDAAHRRRTRARSSTATCSCARCPRSTASRPATRRRAGYILVGSATQERRHRHLGRPRRAQRGGARRRTRSRSSATAWAATTAPRRCARGRPFATRQARPPRRARAARGGPHRRAHGAARRAPARPRARRARASSTARCRRDRGWGRSRSAGAGGTIASVPLVTRRAIAAGLRAAARRRPPGPHADGRDPVRARTR